MLSDFTDCGVSNEVPQQTDELRFSQKCWEACSWKDTPENVRYKVFEYEDSIEYNGETYSFTYKIIVSEPR